MLSKERLGEIRERCAGLIHMSGACMGSHQTTPIEQLAFYDIQTLLDEIDRLRSALSFYADEKNWYVNGPFDGNSARGNFDGGQRARFTLEEGK